MLAPSPFPEQLQLGPMLIATAELPELLALKGVPQPPVHHPEIDTLWHIDLCMQQARRLSQEPALHFAVLVHDLGKGVTPPEHWPHHRGHESAGLPLVEAVCARLAVPADWRQLALLVCEFHLHCHRIEEMTRRGVRRLLRNLAAREERARFELFLLSCEADARGRLGLEQRAYPQVDLLRQWVDDDRYRYEPLSPADPLQLTEPTPTAD